MWWARSELAEVYLSQSCIGLASGRAGAARWIDVRNLDEALARLAEALTQSPLQSCEHVRIWLASTLARPLMLSAASGARNRDEAKGLAAMLAADATGFDEPLRVWANAWRMNRGGMTVVTPERIWAALNGVIDQERKRRDRTRSKEVARTLELTSVRPWWNHVIDAVIAESSRDASRIGWSLAENGGVVHGIVDKGESVEAGFDLLGAHDTDGALLRRRLMINWEGLGLSRHLEFAPDGESTKALLGGWREAPGSRA